MNISPFLPTLAFHLLIILPNTHICNAATSADSEMPLSRQKMLINLIISMYFRKGDSLLASGEIDGLLDSITSKYFASPVYKNFVITFQKNVLPRLTQGHGQPCQPEYIEKYKNPYTKLFDETALHYWLAAHYPDKQNTPQIPYDVHHCDLRQGLVCNPSTSTCECPPGTVLVDGDDSRLGANKHCFVKPMETCQLVNLENSNSRIPNLLKKLHHMIFSPERPATCVPGTQCRFMSPYLNTPRCWCHNKKYPQECTTATIGWFEGGITSDSSTINLREINNLLRKATTDFTATHVGVKGEIGTAREKEVDANFITTASNSLIALYNNFHEIDKDPSKLDHGKVLQLRESLKTNQKCLRDLTDDLGDCQILTNHNTVTCESENKCTYTKLCDCPTSSSFEIFHDKLNRMYGSECLLGVNDDGATCSQENKYVCYRWDLNSKSNGVCSCPLGYGVKDNCQLDDSNNEKRSMILMFINPSTVPYRKDALVDYQEDVDRFEDDFLEQQSSIEKEHECDLELNKEWEEFFGFYTGLKPVHGSPEGVSQLPTKEKLDEVLQKLNEWKDNLNDDYEELCFLHKYYKCVPSSDGKKGTCKYQPDLPIFAGAKKMEDRIDEIIQYVKNSEKVLELAPISEDTRHYKPSRGTDDADTSGSVRDPGKDGYCRPNAFIAPDLENAEFKMTWRVKRRDGTEEVVESLDEPLLKPGDTTEVVCNLDRDKPIGKVCRCSERMEGDDCTKPKENEILKEWKTCEKEYLQNRVEIMLEGVIQNSVLQHGQPCNSKAHIYLDDLRRDMEDIVPDWYFHLYRLETALSLAQKFCDKTKFLTCDWFTDTCDCINGTGKRHSPDGHLIGEYCYVVDGPCNKDPSMMFSLFPTEKREVLAHYGNPKTGKGMDAPGGCLVNLCAFREKGEKICKLDPTYVVFKRFIGTETKHGGDHSRASQVKINLVALISFFTIVKRLS